MWMKLHICLIDHKEELLILKLIKYISVETHSHPITHIEDMYIYLCIKCPVPHIVTQLGNS